MRLHRLIQPRLVLSAALTLAAVTSPAVHTQEIDILDTQIQYNWGQNVAPIFEGWFRNPDGSVDMWFGYLNKNYEEVLHVPVGPDNRIEPGGPDQGQPSVFVPRRRRGGAVSRRENYVFSVRVPPDFDENDELVWTVTAHGKTDRAVATLLEVYALEGPADGNMPPEVQLEADRTTVQVGESVTLTATISDDELPENRRGRAGVTWRLYHGPGGVAFDPARSLVPEDLAEISDLPLTTVATFTEEGTFVIRAEVNDGEINPAGYPLVPSTTFAMVTIDVRP